MACDTARASKLAHRLRASFAAKLYTPKRSLTLLEKHGAAARFDAKVGNAHERDALAAALNAWRHYQNKLKQTEHKLQRLEPAERDGAKRLVLRGVRMSEAGARFARL